MGPLITERAYNIFSHAQCMFKLNIKNGLLVTLLTYKTILAVPR